MYLLMHHMDEKRGLAESLNGVIIHHDDGFVVAFNDDRRLGKGFYGVVRVDVDAVFYAGGGDEVEVKAAEAVKAGTGECCACDVRTAELRAAEAGSAEVTIGKASVIQISFVEGAVREITFGHIGAGEVCAGEVAMGHMGIIQHDIG